MWIVSNVDFSWVNCIYKYGEFGVRINSEPKTITTINTFKDKKSSNNCINRKLWIGRTHHNLKRKKNYNYKLIFEARQ